MIPSGFVAAEFVRPPIDPAEVRSRWALQSPYIAVYAGGFFENKRVDRLVEAVGQTGQQWGLVVLGRDIPSSRYNLEYCQRIAKSRRVELRALGEVPRHQAVAALFAGDAIVLASEYEGFGLLLIEALAAGRPFVSWATGAAPELAARTGAGFSVNSVEEFSRALQELSDPARRTAMGAKARAAAPEFTDARLVERYLAVYEESMAESKSSPR